MYEYSSYFKPFFTLWETILLKWERCNVLDNSGEVLVRPLKPIRKFTFGYLMNLKEKQFKKLARGLIYNCMIYLQGGGGGESHPKLNKGLPTSFKEG